MAQVVEIISCGKQGPVYSTINNMAADDLVTQRARALAVMILTKIFQNILVSWPQGLKHSSLGAKLTATYSGGHFQMCLLKTSIPI